MKVKHDLFHNTTTNKPFSLESTREDGVTFSYRVVRDAVHSGKKWHSALWLKSVHSGKKWWIREFVPLLYILLKSWLCCCSLATLTPQKWHELRNPPGRRQPVGYLQSLIESWIRDHWSQIPLVVIAQFEPRKSAYKSGALTSGHAGSLINIDSDPFPYDLQDRIWNPGRSFRLSPPHHRNLSKHYRN